MRAIICCNSDVKAGLAVSPSVRRTAVAIKSYSHGKELNRRLQQSVCCSASQPGASGSSNFSSSSVGKAGEASFYEGPGPNVDEEKNLLIRLQSMGLAGIVSYGILNTLYYSLAMTVAWSVAKVETGQGWTAAAAAFGKMFAVVWAGSQVTKIARAAGALMMAPVVDKAMGTLAVKLKLKGGKRQAFSLVIFACLALAAVLVSALIVAWL